MVAKQKTNFVISQTNGVQKIRKIFSAHFKKLSTVFWLFSKKIHPNIFIPIFTFLVLNIPIFICVFFLFGKSSWIDLTPPYHMRVEVKTKKFKLFNSNNNSLQKKPPSLRPLNWDITEYLQPGLYTIKNKKNGHIYIGQSSNILKRFGSHISQLNIKIKHSTSFIEDWKNHGLENFEFSILEMGPQWANEKKRQRQERLYFIIYEKNELYNEKTFVFLDKGERETAENLQPLNIDVSFCKEPGIYVVENKKTKRKYTGQAIVLVSRLYDHIEWFELEKKKKKKTFFQKELSEYGISGFFFKIYHHGSGFSKLSYRKEIELKYITWYINNCYNSFIEVEGKIQPINKNTRDMAVYKTNIRYDTIEQAKKLNGISHDRNIRFDLDDPKNETWHYSRSYGRTSFTQNVDLIVFRNETIYFNASLAHVSTGNHSNTVLRHCNGEKLGKRNFRFLNDLSHQEKLQIPDLIWQVIRETRRTIDVPLDLSNSIDLEIHNTQSISYSTSPENQLTLNDLSSGTKEDFFYLLKNRTLLLLGIDAKNSTLSPELISLGEEVALEVFNNYSKVLLNTSTLENKLKFEK